MAGNSRNVLLPPLRLFDPHALGVPMSDPRARKPAKVELVTIHRKDGTAIMSVVCGGKIVEYEMSKRRLSFLLTQAAQELVRE